jgi:DNA-binding NtrC family response regulator
MSHTQLLEKNIEYLPVVYLTSSMKQLYEQCEGLSKKKFHSILITGESGTGKELLAKSIHYSRSPNAPFITMNCINLPFDHFEEKINACMSALDFSGSNGNRPRHAPESTLFLGDLSKLEVNVKQDLLELLSTKIKAMGKNGGAPVRLIFSSKEPLPKTSTPTKGSASVALFNPYQLTILPLRNRRDDINPLATFFMDKYSKEYGKDIGGIHSRAMALLEKHDWPENVSELRDVMENAVLLADGPLITKDDIRFNISKKAIALESFLSREDFFTLEEIEHIYINTVLRRLNNNKSKTAKVLGVSRNTLQRRIDTNEKPPARKKRRKNKNQPRLL